MNWYAGIQRQNPKCASKTINTLKGKQVKHDKWLKTTSSFELSGVEKFKNTKREKTKAKMMYKILNGIGPTCLKDLFAFKNEIFDSADGLQAWINKEFIHSMTFEYPV